MSLQPPSEGRAAKWILLLLLAVLLIVQATLM